MSADADSYVVYRDDSPIGGVNSSLLYYEDTVGPGTYEYGIASWNKCGLSDSTTDGGEVLSPPDVPGNVAASDTSCMFILVTWDDVAEEDGYRIYRDGNGTPIVDLPPGTVMYEDDTVVSGAPHTYVVASYNGCGESPSGSVSGERILGYPAAPATVTASDSSCTTVRIDWSVVADADSYVVYRDGSPIDSVKHPIHHYKDTIGPGTYEYGVSSWNHCGHSDSTTDDGTVPSPPSAPPTVTASDTSCTIVRIDWSAAADADSYVVYRDDSPIVSVNSLLLYYEDVTGPGTYEYGVASWNKCGLSDSTTDEGKVLSSPVAPVTVAASDTSCSIVRIDWSASADADSYVVYRDDSPIAGVNNSLLYYEDATGPGTYKYGVASWNKCGLSDSTTDEGTVLSLPPVPGNVAASDTSCMFILVTWDDVENEQGYRIYRDGSETALTDLPAGTVRYEDDTIESGTPHTYAVAAYNQCGELISGGVVGERIYGYANPPTGVIATGDLCDSVIVTWEYLADPADVDSFLVSYRDTAAGSGWLRAGVVLSEPWRFADQPEPGTFNYWVSAFNRCGSTPTTDESMDEGTRKAVPAAPVFAVESDTTACPNESFLLMWKSVEGATGYIVTAGAVEESVGTDTLFTGAETTPGIYMYTVRAEGECGPGVESDPWNVRILDLPAAPATVVASDTSCSIVRIDWSVSAHADSYMVYRNGTSIARLDSAVHYFEDGIGAGTYEYGIAAGNICGWSDSAVTAGTVAGPPDPPDTLFASDDSCGVVSLWWSATAGVDSYSVYRNAELLVSTPDTFHVDSPSPGGYLYTVTAWNRCGESAARADSGTRPPTTPPVPFNTTASSDSCLFVHVAWGASINADGYDVYRDGGFLASVDETWHYDSTALPGVSYYYSVRAFNSCGTSAEGGSVLGERPPGVPPVPVISAVSNDLCNGISIEWGDVADEDGYYIYRDGEPIDTVSSAEGQQYLDTGALPGYHWYRIAAFNMCTPEPELSDSTEGFLLPDQGVVDDLAADSICEGVRLTWSDVEWEGGYVVLRDGSILDTVIAGMTTYDDLTAESGTTYAYRIGTYNACSDGTSFGEEATGIRPWGAPPSPQNVSATEDLCGLIRVDWSPSDHADGYRVYRNGNRITTVYETFHEDRSISPGTYSYTVRAFTMCDSSSMSASEGGTRPPDAPGAPGNLTASRDNCKYIQLTWTDVADEDGYRVYRDGSPIIVLGADVTSYQDNDPMVVSDVVYHYTVRAFNECGGEYSDFADGERILGYPETPSNVTATDSRCDDVIITWSYPYGSIASIDSFVIYKRAVEPGGNWGSVGFTQGEPLRYTDTPQPGSYDYAVLAVNECGGLLDSTQTDIGTRLGAPSTPSQPGVDREQVCGGQEFTLFWDPVADASSYFVVEEGGGEWSAGSDTFYTTSRTSVGTARFGVRAEGVCGTSDTGDLRDVEIQALPVVPDQVVATDDRCGAIEVSWAFGTASNVWVSYGADTVFVSGVSFWSDSIEEGGERTYLVGGWNSCDTLNMTTEVIGYAYPLVLAMPGNVMASDGLCDSVRITWSYSSEISAVDSFSVIRYDGPVSSTVATVPAGAAHSVLDTNVSMGRTYTYMVRARNACTSADSQTDAGYAYATPGEVLWNNSQAGACVNELYTLRWMEAEDAEQYRVLEDGSVVDSTTGNELTLIPTEVGSFAYEVIAVNECGDGPANDPWILSVGEEPVAPFGVTLDSSACDSVIITWSAQTDSVRVYRSGQAGPVWDGPGDGRAVDHPREKTTYTIRSHNGCGESEGVEIVLPRPRISPSAPSSVTATNAYCDSVVVTWDFSHSDVPIDRIRVLRSRNDTTIVVADELVPEARRFVDRSGEGSYIYEVFAVNGCGTSPSEETSNDPGGFLPPTPQGEFLIASDTHGCVGDSFFLAWKPVPDVLYYQLREVTGGGDQPVAVVSAEIESWVVYAPSPGERVFQIQAGGVCGPGERSDLWTVSITPPPVAPGGLLASDGLCGRVVLHWEKPAGELTGVRVFRDGEEIGFVAASVDTFVDTDVSGGLTCLYSIAGENECGVSDAGVGVPGSSQPGLQAPAPTEPPDGADSMPIPVTVHWNGVNGAAGYTVRVECPSNDSVLVDTTLGVVTAFQVMDLDLGETYRWNVATVGECGEGIPSDWRTFRTLDIAPTALTTYPLDGADTVSVEADIRVTFNFPIDPASLGGARLMSGGSETAGEARLDAGGSCLVFDPDSPLVFGATYVFHFAGLSDIYGRGIEGNSTVTFTTEPAMRPFGDMNGDYQRDLSDMNLVDSILIGLTDVGLYPLDRIDLNNDGLFNVADAVFLAHTLVNQGVSLLPGANRMERVSPAAKIEPGDGPGFCRIDLAFPLAFDVRNAYMEILLPGAGHVARVECGTSMEEPLYTIAGNRLRILLTGAHNRILFPASEESAKRISIHFEGGMPEGAMTLDLMICTDRSGETRLLNSPGEVPLSLAGSILLDRNRPNPFNPVTEIHYYLPEPLPVHLCVFDPSGRVVATLENGAVRSGWVSSEWDGRSDTGSGAASGVYFCRLEAGGESRTIRMTLIR